MMARSLEHLRRGPGRPRKARDGDNPSDIRAATGPQACATSGEHGHGAEAPVTPAPSQARLLDRVQAASYLGISVDTLDRLASHGRLQRLVIPGTRLVRYDRKALDSFISSAQ